MADVKPGSLAAGIAAQKRRKWATALLNRIRLKHYAHVDAGIEDKAARLVIRLLRIIRDPHRR